MGKGVVDLFEQIVRILHDFVWFIFTFQLQVVSCKLFSPGRCGA